MQSVLDTVEQTARQNGAKKVTAIRLVIGDMAAVMDDAMQFAFEVLSEDSPLFSGGSLTIDTVKPRSRCANCGAEFEHRSYQITCPHCGSLSTELLAGREMYIDSIEVEE
jgi:hydrogenase nickel incorporation protein HypA/HybF